MEKEFDVMKLFSAPIIDDISICEDNSIFGRKYKLDTLGELKRICKAEQPLLFEIHNHNTLDFFSELESEAIYNMGLTAKTTLLFDVAEPLKPGDVGLFMKDGKTILYRYSEIDGVGVLYGLNPDTPPIVGEADESLQLVGKYTRIFSTEPLKIEEAENEEEHGQPGANNAPNL